MWWDKIPFMPRPYEFILASRTGQRMPKICRHKNFWHHIPIYTYTLWHEKKWRSFGQTLEYVFGYLKFLLRFVDENLCISDTFENHLKHISIIFRKCEEFNITLNFKKCNFGVEEIKFLCYILTPEGLENRPRKNKEKIYSIWSRWSRPNKS